jgi:carboxymethylenebutenolidase
MKNAACTALFLLLVVPLAAQDPAVDRLNESPRHHEWVTVEGAERAIHTFVVYPEVEEKVPVVLVIHENRGLNAWAKSLADQVAEAGYIAVAPDLLSGMAPGGGRTKDFADPDAARDALYELTDEGVMSDLAAVAEWARSLPATDGKLAVAGFCWGGLRTFQFAATGAGIDAAFVFYGTPADASAMSRIETPVYGFYGGNDARVTATVEPTVENMKKAGKNFEPVIYEGAGHGFMRSGEQPGADRANVKARKKAWERWRALLAAM